MKDTDWLPVDGDIEQARDIGQFLNGGGFHHQVWMPGEGWFEIEPYPLAIIGSEVKYHLRRRLQQMMVSVLKIGARLEVEAYLEGTSLRWWWQFADGALQFFLYENERELKCVHRLIPLH